MRKLSGWGSDLVYAQLKRRARLFGTTLDDELSDFLTTGVAVGLDLPQEMVKALEALPTLEDEALWWAAQSALTPDETERFAELAKKQTREGLTVAEEEETSVLARRFELAMVVRVRATILLQERGHVTASLIGEA